MKFVGKPGEVVRPVGFMGSIPITSFAASFSVGSIPTCRVGIPVEFIGDIQDKATKQLYEVKIGERGDLFTAFKGYVSGRNGRVSQSRIEAGVNLVHPARDMDTMRMLAPSMHSQGLDDWSYSRTPVGGGETHPEDIYFSSSGASLPRQLIDGVVSRLEYWRGQKVQIGSNVEFKDAGYEAAVSLLKTINVLNGTMSDLGATLSVSINEYAKRGFENSTSTQSSLWNSMTEIFGSFGLMFICDCKGQVFVSADMANFQPPDENFFYSDRILSFDQSSSFGRNVREVNLISHGVRNSLNGIPGDNNDSITYTTYPGNAAPDEAGGSIAMAMPGWLSPLNTIQPNMDENEPVSSFNPAIQNSKSAPPNSVQISRAQKSMARKFYNMERNKWRTFSLVVPFMPNAVPGTTVWVQPYSSVRAMSGKQVSSGALYSGYLSQVQHYADVASKVLQTTLVLTHVSEVSEATNETSDPIFTDVKPFVLQ
jgi:hypothetical protein